MAGFLDLPQLNERAGTKPGPMKVVRVERDRFVIVIERRERIPGKKETITHAHVQDVAVWVLERRFTIDLQCLRVPPGLEQWLGFLERLAGDGGEPVGGQRAETIGCG